MIELRPEQLNAMGGCVPCQGGATSMSSSSPADSPTAGRPAGPSVVTVDPTKSAWVGISLTCSGRPVPGAAWEVKLPNGEAVEGRLDGNGKTRLEGLDPGQCTVTFPELDRRGFA
jgi:hypothetical protein